jgi:hypothetical protein
MEGAGFRAGFREAEASARTVPLFGFVTVCYQYCVQFKLVEIASRAGIA